MIWIQNFGGIGIFAISKRQDSTVACPIAKRYPHHGGVVQACRQSIVCCNEDVGVEDVAFNQPASMLYKNENPFK